LNLLDRRQHWAWQRSVNPPALLFGDFANVQGRSNQQRLYQIMIQLPVEDALNEFLKAFTDFGFIQGNHLVCWNERFATADPVRFIPLVESVVRYAIDQGEDIPFDRFVLFLNKGNFDLYFRTVKAYTVWFYDTLTGMLRTSANLANSFKP
jgi:hypothetical protein